MIIQTGAMSMEGNLVACIKIRSVRNIHPASALLRMCTSDSLMPHTKIYKTNH